MSVDVRHCPTCGQMILSRIDLMRAHLVLLRSIQENTPPPPHMQEMFNEKIAELEAAIVAAAVTDEGEEEGESP